MQELWQFMRHGLGLSESASMLTWEQIGLRAVLIYIAGFGLLRLGEHRFVGKNTAFDVVLGFIFGSTLSRAINGTAPFINTVIAGAVLLLLHWGFATLAYYWDEIDVWLNGEALPIVEDGAVQGDNLRRKRINDRLLHENIRLQGHVASLDDVQEAYYERNGSISVLPKQKEARVLDIDVEDGVQTVRIQLET